MELRDIEIFLTVAEELHFGRAAERLHVTPARVSQAIKKQERGVGAKLFERNSRNVRLTPVGEQLHLDLRGVYQGLRDSMERARLAAQGKAGVLHLGMIASNAYDLRPFWEEFRSRHPAWGLRIRHNPFLNPFEPLRNGEVDALICWLPVEEPDLTVGPVVFTESRTMLVPPGHKLADHKSVSAEVLGDYEVLRGTVDPPDYWVDAFTPFQTPSGRPIERGPAISNLDDILTLVGSGEAVHGLAAHAARYHARPDIVYLPIHDAPRLRWALVWRGEAETAPIRALAQVIRDLGTTSL
ncbi:LysR family transcriptional regulator [Nonomuraea sp. NPDC049480]|uniref:LysR family transcriptional regulator n=1 Tax=Nonomuraea sp. NPDC049480 TaxID=3364353 RepID=UPI0037AF366C